MFLKSRIGSLGPILSFNFLSFCLKRKCVTRIRVFALVIVTEGFRIHYFNAILLLRPGGVGMRYRLADGRYGRIG
jgi:hypothetical protein